jgi:hypothetical protein
VLAFRQQETGWERLDRALGIAMERIRGGAR